MLPHSITPANRRERRALRRTFQRNAATPPAAPAPPDELAARIQEALAAERAAVRNEFAETLRTLTQPVRSKLPTPETTTPPAPTERGIFGFGQVRDARDGLYLRLPEQERAWRNPKVDEALRGWIQALATRRMDTAERIRLEVDDDYLKAAGSSERATTLYGTVTATSGLGQGTGGALAPLPFANSLVLARDKRARMRGLVQRFTSDSNTLRVPTAGVATAAMAAEGATAAQGEPTWGSQLLSKKKAQAVFKASEEMLQDSAFNLVSVFAERAGSALAALEDTQICTSNGTAPNITESLGSATITEVAEATSTVLIYEDVVDVFFGLPDQYHQGAAWFGNAQMMGFLSILLDGNGRPIFTPGGGAPAIVGDSVAGQVGTIFGRPVYLVPLANGSLFVGDPSYYGMLDGGPVTVKVSDAPSWSTDLVDFKVTERFDGAVLVEDAWRCVKAIASVA
jgi:HK97 family phage major capsid protein